MKNTILFSLAFVVGVAVLLGGCASRKAPRAEEPTIIMGVKYYK